MTTLIVDHTAPEAATTPEAVTPEAETVSEAPLVPEVAAAGSPSVIVYTKVGCPPCKATVRSLTKKNIPFEARSIDDTPGARDMIAKLGHMQAPVVIAGNENWSGFRPDRIDALAAQLSQI